MIRIECFVFKLFSCLSNCYHLFYILKFFMYLEEEKDTKESILTYIVM
jgi:hypothetical protein